MAESEFGVNAPLVTKLVASRFLQLQDQGISVPCSTLHRKHQHLCFIWFAPNQQLRRQLSNLTLQAKTLNLSTPGDSSNSNLVSHFSDLFYQLLYIVCLFTSPLSFLPVQLVFPVLIPDYFPDNKNTLNF
ncbi:hypothetical protein ATANTOWER_005872 [Ataeniobius toweri]|uniref:Uncharacterized protein n=1 Tax=Ataeniobius toweri TaxID=208326 RepID=A0ABU7BPK6_9TELE|nr:hypothetical protein [Ataeniobius toweri]